MGDNYEVNLCILYSSAELGHLEDQMVEQQHLDDL